MTRVSSTPRSPLSKGVSLTLAVFSVFFAIAASSKAAHVFERVAGPTVNTQGFSGDGGPATAAEFFDIRDVDPMPGGGFLIADTGNRRVRRVLPDGTVNTVAGTGVHGPFGDGGPAIAAEFATIQAVDPIPGGGFLIADSRFLPEGGVIRKVAADGTISRVAGGGPEFVEGESATAARLAVPMDVEALPGGGFLIADSGPSSIPGSARVYRVDGGGMIHTVAGGGTGNGLSGPATDALLEGATKTNPHLGVEPDGADGFFVAVPDLHSVFKVSSTGQISRVAGSGLNLEPGPGSDAQSGDGGTATSAKLTEPTDVAHNADGSFAIADGTSDRIRLVGIDGTISTIAGTGGRESDSDYCQAADARTQRSTATHMSAIPSGGYMLSRDNNRAHTLQTGTPAPPPPHVEFDVSKNSPAVGEQVTLDATGSFDCEEVVKFEWDLDGNGSFESETGTTGVNQTSFDRRGNYKIRVRVTGSSGGTSDPVSQEIAVGPAGISINDGAIFTNDEDVEIHFVWPYGAGSLLLSNDGGFGSASPGTVVSTIPWTLQPSGPERLPKTVYLRLPGFPAGSDTTYTDDIILDQTAPLVRSAVARPRGARVSTSTRRGKSPRILKLRAADRTSGVSRMQLKRAGSRPGAWLRFRSKSKLKLNGKRVLVRVRDRAGNASKWKTIRVRGQRQ